MGLKSFPGGVHPHDFKEFSKKSSIEELASPQKVRIFLSQHIGAPAKSIVKKGDEILAYQKIAEPSAFLSIPMHSPISGKVSNIADYMHPNGTLQQAIEIINDNENKSIELVDEEKYLDLSVDEMKSRIKEAGICGMGGAGFPTFVKLSPPPTKKIDYVILNGVECEPFLTADYRLMLENGEEIVKGLEILIKTVDAKKGFIGIEANKPDAIKKMQKIVKNITNIDVVKLKIKYPQGAEKQLIYAATKRKVPNKGGLPMDVGVVVQNVGTSLAVYEAVRFKKPLVERIISVTGPVVKNPKNFKAKIGSLYSDLVEACGGTTGEVCKVISGGPMMGFSVPSLDISMTKGSSGVLLFDEKLAGKDAEHTCIRCAGCIDVCPLNLLPSIMANGAKYEDWDSVEKAGVMDCMKCGTCAYVCPANIKLIQWIDIGKQKVGTILRERNKK